MKLTKETLRRIIKEELDAVLNEEELDEGIRDYMLGGALALGVGAANLPDTSGMTISGSDQVVQVDDADNDASSAMFPREQMKLKAIKIEKLFKKAKKLKNEAETAKELNRADRMMDQAEAEIEENSDYFKKFGFEFNENEKGYRKISK
jgi:hypothetical protein